jgi:AraC-like DNA-binding protein
MSADTPISWEKWRELSFDVLSGLEVEVNDPDHFELHLAHQQRGTLKAASLLNCPHAGIRTSSAVRQRPVDTVSIMSLKAGQALLEFQDREVIAGPGDMLLHDLERPFRTAGLRGAMVEWKIVHLGRSLLEGEFDAIRDVGDLKLDGNAPENRVLRAYLDELHGSLAEMDATSASAFEDTTVEMLRSALVLRQRTDQTRNTRALHRVQALLLTRIRDPKLRIEEVSREIGIPPRTIHRLFQSIGTTPMRWIEEQRLSRIALELRSTTHACRSITQLALSCGYNDQSSFGRAFKRRFGVSPSDYRGTGRCEEMAPVSEVKQR